MADLLAAPRVPRPTAHLPPQAAGDRIAQLVDSLAADARFVHVNREPPRRGRTAATARPLPPALAAALPVGTLWRHQADAVDLLRARTSSVVATGTASGKSLCYQIPAAEVALDGGAALLVFPTKALAHDQLAGFAGWAPAGVTVAAYDGDCSPAERHWVRGHADVVLTNPEMLHLGILANHRRWERLLRGLRLVVLDELHTLRGTFGSHVCHVLRRLRRLARLYSGSEPVFAFTSATVGDPAGLASALCGHEVAAVTHDTAPRGGRDTVLWNPQASAPPAVVAGRSTPSLNLETASMAARLVEGGLRTLVFCRSRRAAEIVANEVRRRLARGGSPGTGPGGAAAAVRAYRAGYLRAERREIEHDLAEGSLRCVVATNALELGVDIDGLDAVVLSGYPGTSASFRQQIGRCGRGRHGLAVLVAGDDQLDQWLVRHPRELFRRPAETAVVNPSNPHVLLPHLGCAADELPLRRHDESLWGDDLDDAVLDLVRSDRLRLRPSAAGTVACWSGRGAPAPTVGLRNASRGEFAIRRDDAALLGTVESCRAFDTVHPGAIYLHQGAAWEVDDLDLPARTARVVPADGSTYTQALTRSQVRLLEPGSSATVGSVLVHHGRVAVTTQVTGYVVRSTDRHEVRSRRPLELPATTFDTTAVWWTFPAEVVAAARVGPDDLAGGLHAVEHAGIAILPLFALCDRWDVGGLSSPRLADTGSATVVIHDGQPGGAGIAPLAFAAAASHLRATLEVLEGCPCSTGCPSCVQSPKCGNGNEPLHKDAAVALLRAALGQDRRSSVTAAVG